MSENQYSLLNQNGVTQKPESVYKLTDMNGQEKQPQIYALSDMNGVSSQDQQRFSLIDMNGANGI